MGNNIDRFTAAGRKFLRSDDSIVNEADGLYSDATRSVFTRPQGVPNRFYMDFAPEGETSFVFQTVEGPEEGKYWIIYRLEADVPAECSLQDLTINGNTLGLNIEGVKGSFIFTDYYGPSGIEIRSDDLIQIRVTNTNLEQKTFSAILYGREFDV
jgi:hypothetical protein